MRKKVTGERKHWRKMSATTSHLGPFSSADIDVSGVYPLSLEGRFKNLV